MGWRERDWARFTDEERRRYYGGGAPSYSPPCAPAQTTSLLLKTVLLSLVIGVLGGTADFGWSRLRAAPASGTHVLYGTAAANGMFGNPAACTDEQLSSTGAWTCMEFTLAANGEQILPAARYPGDCTHLVVDQARGAWTCVTPTA